MSLSDITSVFSRYFVVGFFLPAYGALVALWLAGSSQFVPSELRSHGQATQLAILGAAALVGGLALSGLNYPITRILEGYPLMYLLDLPVVRWWPRLAIALQHWRYERWRVIRDDAQQANDKRAAAGWRLDQYFPHDANDFLPTRLGNAVRAFERHSNERWGLDGITIWPRIDALLDGDERELHVDAKIDVYVFLNAAIGSLAVGTCLIVDKALHAPHPAWKWALCAIPFALAYGLYRGAVGPAVRWGDAVRSSIDLHRLELYDSLGLCRPTSFTDERQRAVGINQALLYGRPPLPDGAWGGDKPVAAEKGKA